MRATYIYDDNGSRLKVTQPRCQRTNVIYDSGPNAGKVRSVEEPADTSVVVRPVQNGTESVEKP